jgi:hypothetical protein
LLAGEDERGARPVAQHVACPAQAGPRGLQRVAQSGTGLARAAQQLAVEEVVGFVDQLAGQLGEHVAAQRRAADQVGRGDQALDHPLGVIPGWLVAEVFDLLEDAGRVVPQGVPRAALEAPALQVVPDQVGLGEQPTAQVGVAYQPGYLDRALEQQRREVRHHPGEQWPACAVAAQQVEPHAGSMHLDGRVVAERAAGDAAPVGQLLEDATDAAQFGV